MANAVFPLALEGFLAGEIDLNTAVIKCMFVRSYTYDATDKFVSDLSGITTNGTSAALTTPTVTLGVFDADDTTITTTANANDHYLIVFQSSAVTGGADVATSAQRVIAYYDTGTGLPIQPGTGATPVTWSNGASKIFKLA